MLSIFYLGRLALSVLLAIELLLSNNDNDALLCALTRSIQESTDCTACIHYFIICNVQ
jgi:hypothetical protein